MNTIYNTFIGAVLAILIAILFYCVYRLGGTDTKIENSITNMEYQNKITELENRLSYSYRIELDYDSIRVYDNITNEVVYTESSTTTRPSSLQIALLKDNE